MKEGTIVRRIISKMLRRATPVVITLGMAYLSVVYCYYICWREVYQHHSRATGIGLIVGEVIWVFFIYFIWIEVIVVGPGFQPYVPLYRLIKDGRKDYQAIDPPKYFMSDKNGYPIWCSNCQSIKLDRSHHSSELQRCVGRFDHYCTMIGALIGKRNYRLFLQLVFWFLLFFVYVIVSSAVFAKSITDRRGGLNANIIILFVATVFWFIMLAALFTSHIYYISINITSIDDIITKRHRRQRTENDQFVNFKHGEKRFVLRINPEKEFIWSHGFKKNWTDIMGTNPLFWLVPWGTPMENYGDPEATDYDGLLGDFKEEVSTKTLQKWVDDVEKGNYITLSP